MQMSLSGIPYKTAYVPSENLKAPYSSKIDILLSKKGLIIDIWY